MEANSFFQLGSLQNIYISKSILNNETNSVFNALFKELNGNSAFRNKRFYFKSLSLTSLILGNSSLFEYDCDLTLYYIRRNIHFNLKTEGHIFQYFAHCSQLALKNVLLSENKISREFFVFSDFFVYVIWSILILILISGCVLARSS